MLASLNGNPRPGSGGHPEVAYGIFTAVTRPPLRTDGHAFHHLAFRRIAQSAPLTPTQSANRGPVLSVAPSPKPKMEIEGKHRKMLPSPPAPPRPAPSAVARMWNLQHPPTLGTPRGGSPEKKEVRDPFKAGAPVPPCLPPPPALRISHPSPHPACRGELIANARPQSNSSLGACMYGTGGRQLRG